MSRLVGVIILIVLLLIVAGILIAKLMDFRVAGDRVRCQDHLRRIGFATFHAGLPNEPIPTEIQPFIPAGTVPNPGLTPEERLAWYVLALRALEQGPSDATPGAKKSARPTPLRDTIAGIDLKAAWDAAANARAAHTRVSTLLCPANMATWPDGEPALTQYVGMAGIGLDVAALSRDQAGKRAGAFRYDDRTPLDAITDGLSHTISVAETNRDLGPWIRGGPSTVRGLDPNATPYLGRGRQLAGLHLRGGNFGFADGSARFIAETIDPAVFRAQLTIAGGEKDDFDLPE
jgi:prepilin-type processing-associated H-X9-DG protein